jgi:hypothetical protein
MKNIYVLQTDKPSRLYLDRGKLWIDNLVYGSNNQHIYITSDEEIKEGDWVLFEGNDTIRKAIDSTFTSGVNNIRIHADKKIFKIILTTDGDLIKDGVQAIDDEFLEWFVKNPSCEVVEVEDYYSYGVDNWKYLIIIPKEQKQTDEKGKPMTYWGGLKKPKQETTPEEVAEYLGFVKGVKWQQERSYSEEEVKQAYIDGSNNPIEEDDCYGTEFFKYMDDWFEQFKK